MPPRNATFCPQSGTSGQGVSFESWNYPAKFIRHYDFTACIAADGGSDAWDATALWSQDSSWLVATAWAWRDGDLLLER